MKTKIFVLLFSLFIIINCYSENNLIERINRYSGKNANDLITYLDSLSGLKSYYADYIFNHMSDNDLASIQVNYIDHQLNYAIKTIDLPYTKQIPEEYFLHFVLPIRVSQEPFENWRGVFYEELYSQVSQVETINEAILIADLYYQEGIYFKQTSGRDQGPITSIKRGYGRCEEMMILQMAILRSLGIPCRPASAPYWSFTDSNHVWTEVWTPQGWKIVPEAYPEKYKKSSWEVDRAKKAPLITTEAFGTYDSPLSLAQSQFDTKLNISDVYGETVSTLVTVIDQDNLPVEDAEIVYYATSFGGLFNLLDTNSDENGQARVDFRPTSLFVTAGKDGKSGYGLINSFEDNNSITIQISENQIIDANYVLNFPLDSSSSKDFGVKAKDKDYIDKLTDLANKKRDNRLLKNSKGIAFLKNYPLPDKNENKEDYLTRRDKFLEKCQDLAGNADNWLYIDDKISSYSNHELVRKLMIDLVLNWDIKDLIELPDTTAIEDLLLTLSDSYTYYSKDIDYDLFVSNVINNPFGSAPFPQTAWQSDLAKVTKELRAPDIAQTMKNIDLWLKENIIFDQNPGWSYFGGSLTPIQLINKKYLTKSQQIYLRWALMQNVGIASRWQGFLEYYDGNEWIEVILEDKNENNDTPPVKRELIEFELEVISDGKKIQAQPWGNFLISSKSQNGYLTYDWFDVEETEEKYLVKFYAETGVDKYIQGYIRNKNGDANLIIKPLSQNTKKLTLSFVTPKSSHENKIDWSENTLANINQLLSQNKVSEGKTLVMILHNQGNEPQERMLEQLLAKAPDFAKKEVNILVYSQERLISKLAQVTQENLIYINGEQIITEDISLDNYPVLFLLDSDKIISSANGFDLDLINYLHRLVD